jgi:hypothetical protein
VTVHDLPRATILDEHKRKARRQTGLGAVLLEGEDAGAIIDSDVVIQPDEMIQARTVPA